MTKAANPTMAPDPAFKAPGAIVADIARVLRAEMERQEMSFNELARRSKLPPSRVHGVLTGTTPNPGILTVQAIAVALGKDLAWLGRQLKAKPPEG